MSQNANPRPAPAPTSEVPGDPHHPPTTQVDQDRSPAGDRGEGGQRHAEQLRRVEGVPDPARGRAPADAAPSRHPGAIHEQPQHTLAEQR